MKIAIVGATGTIGSAVLADLSKSGHEMIGVSRNSSPPLDIESMASIENFYASVSPLDAIICVAGNAAGGPVQQLTDADVLLGVQSKLMGQINLARRGLKHIHKIGCILLTGGIFAYKPLPGTFGYAIPNMGLNGFVSAASVDLPEGPRLNVIHPPLVKETALKFNMNAEGCPPAAEVAKAYANALHNNKTGQALFMEGHGPED